MATLIPTYYAHFQYYVWPMDKHFISADALLADSYTLADAILSSDFKPDFIIAIWRGGAPVAAAIHEYFTFKHINTDHIAIRASSYQGIDQQDNTVRLYGMEYVLDNLHPNSHVLLVDDIFDTGNTMTTIIQTLTDKLPSLAPNNIKTATPWYKPSRNQSPYTPDYYLHSTDKWVVFPHELCGLSLDEIIDNKRFTDSTKKLFTP